MTAIIGTNGTASKPCDSNHGDRRQATASAPNQQATASGSNLTARKAAVPPPASSGSIGNTSKPFSRQQATNRKAAGR